ncbi:MAG: hypothetical protein K2X63_06965 [Burkholderiaceae bacterium]|nr:hypothetical protein [Burkholderiaceae bacterium]
MSAQFQQPDFSGMNDPLCFVKKLWGDMQLPGMVTPTVSIDELDKKIQDLKTVESWLNVNMNMLKGTIQALEVQRATIATLKSMGESFAQQMQASSDSFDQRTTPQHEGHIRPDWPMPESSTSNEPEASGVAEEEEAEPDAEVADVVEVAGDAAANTATARATASAAASNSETPFGSPAAWWGLLQDQFKQAVSQAMQSEQPASAVKSSRPVKTSAKTPAKTSAPGTAKSASKTSGRASPVKKTAPATKAQASKKVPAKPNGTSTKKTTAPKKNIVRKKS